MFLQENFGDDRQIYSFQPDQIDVHTLHASRLALNMKHMWLKKKSLLTAAPRIIISHQSVAAKPQSPRRTLLSPQHCPHLKWTSDQMSLSIPRSHRLYSNTPLAAN